MPITVTLPTLHPDQVKAYHAHKANRYLALRAGRRWGKTDFDKTLVGDGAIKGRLYGWFAPDYKRLSEAFHELSQILKPVKKSSSLSEGVFRTITDGRIDFWTLEDEDAGRSRKYHGVIVDEGAFTKANMIRIWERSIKPTLLDYRGWAVVSSNTNGVDPENFMWQICNEEKHGFGQFHAPTHNNPYLPPEEIVKLQTNNHPLVYQQEYLAQFVDWSGDAFFSLDKLLDHGSAVPYPVWCDTVFAVVDTAIKTGSANDGTAVTYYSTSQHVGHKLVILDYDYIQMEGDSLRDWLPSVFERLEVLARQCGARMGSAGIWIEDANSGTILLQHAVKQGWMAHPIATDLVAKGKDGRAISVSTYVHQGLVKLSEYAYNKVLVFKGTSRNHLVAQIVNFRIGDKDAARRADDLLDTFTYGVSLSLGNSDGY